MASLAPLRTASESEILSAYWGRTIALFAGPSVCVTLEDGRERTGVLTPDGRLLAPDGSVHLPLGQIRQIETL